MKELHQKAAAPLGLDWLLHSKKKKARVFMDWTEVENMDAGVKKTEGGM